MAEELFCNKHGQYPASAKMCPYCARERGELPPAPASLSSNADEYTQGPTAPPPSYSDDDETVLPGQVGRRGNAAPTGRGGDDTDETIPPSHGGRRSDGDDGGKTQLPERKRGGRFLEDEDDDVDVTRIKAKEQTGLMGWLIVKSSGKYTNMRRGTVIEFRSGYIFGRSRKAKVVIDDEDVSAFHAVIKIEDDKFFVADMASSNGTFVNGTKITGGAEIQQDDEITMGDTVFVLKTLK